MAIITLTTDLGLRDHYVAVLKGKILNLLPTATIIDISHEIIPFNIQQAAFVLKNSYSFFPPGTIHLVNVHGENNAEAKCIILQHKNHFFLAANNGILSLVIDGDPGKIFEINEIAHSHAPFARPDILCEAACSLASGRHPAEIGKVVHHIETKKHLKAPDTADMMQGNVIYIDHFGNVIINILFEQFEKLRSNRRFILHYRRTEYFDKLSKSYSDVAEGDKLCLFNASGYLEIAINKGNASDLLGLHIDDKVQIEFE